MINLIRPAVALLLVLVVLLCSHDTCHSFQPSSQLFLSTRSATASATSSQSATNTPTSSNINRRFSTNTHFFTDPSSNIHDQTPPPPSFEQRMREQLKQHQSTSTPSTNNGHASSKLVPDVRTLQDYKDVLDQTGDDGMMMAVLWYSPWCKACRAVLPGIRTLAKRHPDVQFVQVPVLAENANLHQGLDVPSVPFLHLYVPDDPRLVEEKKMTRKRLSAFQRLLLDYERGSCSLEQMLAEGEGGVWSTDCPYSFPTKNSGELTKASSGIASEGEITLQ